MYDHLCPFVYFMFIPIISSFAARRPRKEVNRAWNAFFYTFGSVATPCLVTKDRLEEIVVACLQYLIKAEHKSQLLFGIFF